MIGVLQFPGSNCDMDIIHVIKDVLNEEARLVFFKKQEGIKDLDGLVIPGGFTYGDHLRAGSIAAKMPVLEDVKELAADGKPVLGICNGFQVLCESGMLPGALTNNNNMKFISKWTELEVNNTETPFTKKYGEGEIVRMPVAHGAGRYYCDEDSLKKMEENDQICFRYHGENPNGSVDNIAGICNKEGNVLGLMPHPERASESILGSEDGRKMFEGMIEYIKSR
jgi:phosphoribosylformylglycinamidine synthase